VNCSVIKHSFNTRGGIIYYPGGIKMKRSINGRKSLIAILLLSILLIPVTSTISAAQGKPTSAAGQAEAGGTAGINKATAAAGHAGGGGTAGINKATAAAGQAGAGGTAGMSTAAIVGISAAVVAAGAVIAVAANDEGSSSSAHHHH